MSDRGEPSARVALRGLAVNAGLVLTSVILTLIVVEAGARLWFFGSLAPLRTDRYEAFRKPHPVLGWSLVPGLDVWLRHLDFSVRYRTNGHGFHDRERSYEKPDGVYRIAVLGDSFMEAYVVPYEASFSARLAAELNRSGDLEVETINLGVGGYGTVQEYLVQRRIARRYDPDLVLVAHLPANDVRNNSRALEEALWRDRDLLKVSGRPYVGGWSPDGTPRIDLPDADFIARKLETFRRMRALERPWWEGLVLADYVRRLAARLEPRDRRVAYDPNVLLGPVLVEFDAELGSAEPPEGGWAEPWARAHDDTYRLLEAMAATAAEEGRDFCAFAIPSRRAVQADDQAALRRQFPTAAFDFSGPYRRFRSRMARSGVCAIDLLEAFRGAHAREGVSLYNQIDDSHWNAAGHALAARVVADALRPRLVIP